jgi:hypothetical protein
VGRKEPLIGLNRHNRDADRVRLVRERKPIDPDAALVQRLRRREEAAVTALVVLVASATRKIDRFRGTAAFRSWLYRITLNAACQKRRGRRGEGLLPFAERLPC